MGGHWPCKNGRSTQISEFNGIPTKLQALKDKYGMFFSYYHSLEGTSE